MREVEKFIERAKVIPAGYVFAAFTDAVMLEAWPLTEEKMAEFCAREVYLLEARVFCETREIRLLRGDVGRPFLPIREIDDDAETREYFTEEQYLDIDESRSKEKFAQHQNVRATGGGLYHLPLPGMRNAKLRIHNYIDYYEETGQAYISDWRLAGLFNEERRG